MPLASCISLNSKMIFSISRQQEACSTFEAMSEKAKEELKLQRGRRVDHFQKSLTEFAELEVKRLKLL